MDKLRPTLTEAATALRDGSLTSAALTESLIARADSLDEHLSAYQMRFDESALESAVRADVELAAGADRGWLHGIPIGINDVISFADGPITAGRFVLDPNWGWDRDAPVITRLREAGAVVMGKLTTMEFASAVRTDLNSPPVPRNPWDPSAYAGGSSSGAGSAVAAGLVLAALGTDTGGSIRIPAAFCGVSGLVPTVGRVPRAGCVPLGYTLDQVGPLALTAKDCALLLSVIAGIHPTDPSSVKLPVPDYAANLRCSLHGCRVGVERKRFPRTCDPALAASFETALGVLEELGAKLVEVSLPCHEEMLLASRVTIAYETLGDDRRDPARPRVHSLAQGRNTVSQETRLASTEYINAQRARRHAQVALTGVFEQVDVVASPTIALGAIPYDYVDGIDMASEDFGRYSELFFTPYWDCVGNPVLAAPMGFTAAGLPLSMQLAGPPFGEQAVLAVGHAFQAMTPLA
jgi:aspartyl-tRNA(Asn)/glutamyl-tRNA(Gln) amidotransferase subunit A